MAIVSVPANPQVSQNTYGAWTNPQANMGLYNASNQPAISNLITNPYFIQALAGIGESLDPQGVGGALGRGAKAAVSSRQAAKSNASTLADSNKRHQDVLDALDRFGGMTPKGEYGPSSVSMGPDGGLTMKIDPRTPVEVKPPPRAPDRDTSTSVPSTTVTATTPYEIGPPYGQVGVTPPQPITPEGVPTGPPAGPMGGSPSYGELTRPVPSSKFSAPATSIIPFYQAPLRSRKVR